VNVQALQNIAARRIPVYWFLSDLFLMPPCIEQLPRLHAAVEEGCGEHAMALEHGLSLLEKDAAALDGRALSDEFDRLLGSASGLGVPSESLHRHRGLQRRNAEPVTAAYQEAGFGLPVSSVTPADHIGVELKFMALLSCREMQGWREDNWALATSWLQRERRFLDEHLLQWAPDYCALLTRETRLDFYRGLAALTTGMLLCERQHVASLLARSPAATAEEYSCALPPH
jgi:putative dimethyl sulfoxide reductase chaperone